jgi:hypothetical protein
LILPSSSRRETIRTKRILQGDGEMRNVKKA